MRKGFSKGVRNLILGSYREDLDKPVPYVFAKVMVTYVDVLGTDNLKTLLANFLNQKHDRKYVS